MHNLLSLLSAALLLVNFRAVVADEGHGGEPGHEHGHDGDHAFEWAASFDLMANQPYVWQAQKTGCPVENQSYADPSMMFVMVPLDNSTAEGLEAAEETAEELFEGDLIVVSPGFQSIMPGVGIQLTFDDEVSTSMFPFNVTKSGAYGIFLEHDPSEFEFDEHYLVSDGEDVEAVALLFEEEDGHSHGHTTECVELTDRPDCSCLTADMGEMNCENTTKVEEAYQYLVSNKCNEGCNCYDEGCAMNFYFLDMHHKGCDEDALPLEVEEGFHDFEGSCQRCYQQPYMNPALDACDPIDCKDRDSIEANITYLSTPLNDCITTGCAAGDCQEAWRTMIAYHDSCCDSDLPETIEETYTS
uniref:Uncharacterized protein n=1 Tax=Lotharella globosa TaxID=91324 RepID=A0A7S3YE20_9EUKA